MADALDSKSSSRECGFKSHLGHQIVVRPATQWMDCYASRATTARGITPRLCMRTTAHEGSTLCSLSPIGRGSWLRTNTVRVRISWGVPPGHAWFILSSNKAITLQCCMQENDGEELKASSLWGNAVIPVHGQQSYPTSSQKSVKLPLGWLRGPGPSSLPTMRNSGFKAENMQVS